MKDINRRIKLAFPVVESPSECCELRRTPLETGPCSPTPRGDGETAAHRDSGHMPCTSAYLQAMSLKPRGYKRHCVSRVRLSSGRQVGEASGGWRSRCPGSPHAGGPCVAPWGSPSGGSGARTSPRQNPYREGAFCHPSLHPPGRGPGMASPSSLLIHLGFHLHSRTL